MTVLSFVSHRNQVNARKILRLLKNRKLNRLRHQLLSQLQLLSQPHQRLLRNRHRRKTNFLLRQLRKKNQKLRSLQNRGRLSLENQANHRLLRNQESLLSQENHRNHQLQINRAIPMTVSKGISQLLIQMMDNRATSQSQLLTRMMANKEINLTILPSQFQINPKSNLARQLHCRSRVWIV